MFVVARVTETPGRVKDLFSKEKTFSINDILICDITASIEVTINQYILSNSKISGAYLPRVTKQTDTLLPYALEGCLSSR